MNNWMVGWGVSKSVFGWHDAFVGVLSVEGHLMKHVKVNHHVLCAARQHGRQQRQTDCPMDRPMNGGLATHGWFLN